MAGEEAAVRGGTQDHPARCGFRNMCRCALKPLRHGDDGQQQLVYEAYLQDDCRYLQAIHVGCCPSTPFSNLASIVQDPGVQHAKAHELHQSREEVLERAWRGALCCPGGGHLTHGHSSRNSEK